MLHAGFRVEVTNDARLSKYRRRSLHKIPRMSDPPAVGDTRITVLADVHVVLSSKASSFSKRQIRYIARLKDAELLIGKVT